MGVTILECLENAEYNLKSAIPAIRALAMEQLHNAIVLLDRGYNIDDKVEPLIEQYGDVESVPDKD